jgi:hypothetical protein
MLRAIRMLPLMVYKVITTLCIGLIQRNSNVMQKMLQIKFLRHMKKMKIPATFRSAV